MPREKLKNFGKFLKVYLITAIGAIALLCSCEHVPSLSHNEGEAETLSAAQEYEQLTNPTFCSISEVIAYQRAEIEDVTVDELFISLPEYVLKDVVKVLLTKNASITKKDIIEEYRRSSEIYNTLSAPKSSTDNPSTAAKDSTKQTVDNLISSSVKRRTDTVNGRAVGVITKTEERYE